MTGLEKEIREAKLAYGIERSQEIEKSVRELQDAIESDNLVEAQVKLHSIQDEVLRLAVFIGRVRN